MKLTEAEKQAVRNGQPVEFRQDDVDCVVVRADLFQRLRGVLEQSLPDDVVSALVDQSMAEYDVQDPLLASYQSLRK